MFTHLASILVLAILSAETYRTTTRFGSRRIGVTSHLLAKPQLHYLVVLFYVVAAVFLYPVETVPIYVPVGLIALSAYYLVALLRWSAREKENEGEQELSPEKQARNERLRKAGVLEEEK